MGLNIRNLVMQKTTFLKKEATVLKEKKWYLIDASGLILGRLAVVIANLLRGKNKVIFSPHLDCGDYVIVINTKNIRVSANKANREKRYFHSGYIGGLKTYSLQTLLTNKPNQLIYDAVRLMLPKNKLSAQILRKLFLYQNNHHNHTAQNPILFEIC